MDFSLPLPRDWELTEDLEPGIPLAVREPAADLPFHASLTVAAESVPAGTDLETWQDQAEETMPQYLYRYLLLDREPRTDGPHPVVRRLAHHESDGSMAVTLEQWCLLHNDWGYTVSASTATLTYDRFADLFAGIAAGFVPGRPSNPVRP